MGKINASDKIMFRKSEKQIKYGYKRNFYINLYLKDCLDRIHSLLKPADARGSDDISDAYRQFAGQT